MDTRRGVRVPVPERSRRRGEGGTRVDAGADDHQPPDTPAGGYTMEDKRYAMHSFRVGGAVSRNMDGTAMNVLMEYVGWTSATVARRYLGLTASAAAAGVKRSRETVFLEVDALPLPEQFARSYAALPPPTDTDAKLTVWV